MKKIIKILIIALVFIPFINVDAIGKCYDGLIDINTGSFSCTKVEGDTLTFNFNLGSNNEDYSKYFSYTIDEEKTATITMDSSIKFIPSLPEGVITVSDSANSIPHRIKNTAYTTTTSTTTSTTTKDPNAKTFTVTLNPNDGTNKKETKSCDTKKDETTCMITLPKIDKETFNGWGTAPTCKEGNSGTVKVDKDITYYACYTDNEISTSENESEEPSQTLMLKTLSLSNKDNEEKLDFGTFSIKKFEYEFKVLNEVENINVEASAEEGKVIDVTGNENLQVGENKIIIKLKKGETETNQYVIKVTRLKEGETISNIRYLSSLVVGGYNIDFSKDKLIYNLTIPSDIDKLEITALPESEEDAVEIIGNESLIDGSSISINVTNNDSEPTVYTINITKESSTNYLLFIAIGIVVLLIILLIVLIIIKSKQKKNNSNNKPQVLKQDNKQESVEILNI